MWPYKKISNRVFCCFVCGTQYETYEEFKDHVIAEHVEGREYVVCKQCKAPVRDLRLHYKVKHQGKKPPKNGQMKATVWYDFSGQKRKRDKKKPNFKEGYFISLKNNGKEMHYRSGYELEVYQILEEHNQVERYEVEPVDCVTQYYDTEAGKLKKYFPDLKVLFKDGHFEVWEIKPSNQTDIKQNQSKWEACAKYMSNRGITFCVKTEKGINKLRNQVLEQKTN